MVVDASVWLEILFREEHAEWCASQLTEHAAALRMSTVNLTEALIRIRDKQPHGYDEGKRAILESGMRFVAPDVAQAETAAAARLRFPINPGDCFAYALAMAESCAILTTDRDFRVVDCPVVLPTL